MHKWVALDLSKAVLSEEEAKLWMVTEGVKAVGEKFGCKVEAPVSCAEVRKESGVIEPISYTMVGGAGLQGSVTGHLALSGWSGIAFVSWKSGVKEVPVKPWTFFAFSSRDVSISYRDPFPDGSDLRILQVFYGVKAVPTPGAVKALLFEV